MIVNIAFNTIIYIMVFLFPGIIYRRVYFTGDIRNRFDSGSNFERILFAILLSVFCIALFTTCGVFIDNYTENYISNLAHFSEREILCVFEDIYSNHYPDALRSKDSLLRVFLLFFTLYIFSAFCGWISHKLIYGLKLYKSISVLQFGNQWEFFTESNKRNNFSHRFGDRAITQLDIKTKNDELISGTYKKFINKDDNSVEAIILKDAYKFYRLSKKDDLEKINEIKKEIEINSLTKIEHLDTESTYVYKKRIAGNFFILEKENIENMSITYIKLENVLNKRIDQINTAVSIILFFLFFFCLANSIWDFNIFAFKSNLRRIIFPFIFSTNAIFFIRFLESLVTITINEKKIKTHKWNKFVIFIYSVLPYLYIFGSINGWWITICMAVLLPFIFRKYLSDPNQEFQKSLQKFFEDEE